MDRDVVDLWTLEHTPEVLRETLAVYLDVAPDEVPLTRTPEGKPQLPPGRGPAFSLSHTAGLAVIAVTAREAVGVDIELATRRTPQAVMRRALTDEELQAIQRLPAAERDEAFLRHWTVKEAYLKALGTGLAAGLRSVSVADALAAPRVADAEFSAQRFDPRPGVLGAVVVAGPPWAARPRAAPRSL
jgi:4'-phosphopantetheinyl transferase